MKRKTELLIEAIETTEARSRSLDVAWSEYWDEPGEEFDSEPEHLSARHFLIQILEGSDLSGALREAAKYLDESRTKLVST